MLSLVFGKQTRVRVFAESKKKSLPTGIKHPNCAHKSIGVCVCDFAVTAFAACCKMHICTVLANCNAAKAPEKMQLVTRIRQHTGR